MQTTKHLTLKERRRIQKKRKRKLYRFISVLAIGIFAFFLNTYIFGQSIMNNDPEYYDIEKNVSHEINFSSIKNAASAKTVKLKSESYDVDPDYSISEADTNLESTVEVITEPSVEIKDKVKKKVTKVDSRTKKEMYVPGFCGSVHPYMGWACITDKTSPQYKLKLECESYDDDGFGKIGERYAVAMKPYYGDIGDFIDVIQNDGVEYHCVIVDHKGMENKSEDGWLATYAHGENDIVEFVVNKDSWYGTDKTVAEFHPEFSRNIKTIYNVGSYWD